MSALPLNNHHQTSNLYFVSVIFSVLLLRFGFSRYMRLDRAESQGPAKSYWGILTFLSSLSKLIMK